MIDFGYTISPDRQTDLDKGDLQYASYLLSLDRSLELCIGCGSCTATCTAGDFTDFNIRRLHTMVRRGDTSTLKSEIRKCMFCGKCQLVCPRGVNLRNVILILHRAIERLG